jgi:hypothetical protein
MTIYSVHHLLIVYESESTMDWPVVENLKLREAAHLWHFVPRSFGTSRERYPDTAESGETYDVEWVVDVARSYQY